MKKPKKKIPAAGTEKPARTIWWKGSPDEAKAWKEKYGPVVYFQGDKVSDFLWPRLTDEQMFDPAFEAIARADYNKDFQTLIEFVRTNTLSEWGRELLADFLHRQLIHKRLPIYEVPTAELALSHAKERVKKVMAESGLSQADAIDKVSAEEGMDGPATLENSLNGKRGSGRRAAKGFRGAVPKKKT
jgi:hypothetical protein